MVKFVYPSGENGWIEGARGEVIDVKRWSETHVTSTPGSTTYNHFTKQMDVQHPTIRSHSVERGQVWIRTKEGKDVEVTLPVAVAVGQELCVLWGNHNSGTMGTYLYWWNINSQKHGLFPEKYSDISNFAFTSSERKEVKWRIITKPILIGVAIGFFLLALIVPYWGENHYDYGSAHLTLHTGLGIFGAVLGLIFGFIAATIRDSRFTKKELPIKTQRLLNALSDFATKSFP